MVRAKLEQLLDEVSIIEEEKEILDYHAFIFWFLSTAFRMSDQQVLDSICDGTHDKGVDAVVVDAIEKHVTIIQSKFSADGGKTSISRSDVEVFAKVKNYFRSRKAFKNSVGDANPAAARLLEAAYQALRKQNYTLELVFLSTHKEDDDLTNLVYNDLGFHPLEFTFYGYKRIMSLYQDSLRDYTPKTGHYDLGFKDEDNIILRRDPDSSVNSWVLNVPIEDIRALMTRFPRDLFRKNVRNFLGKSKTNKAIQKTLKDEPKSFWYYNNGITILCDKADLDLVKSHIRLVNPQVVNGCQTVTSIKQYKGELLGDVLVRIVQSDNHDFIQSITLAQNTSNPVKARDFKSNDPVQVRLKRELKKKRYYYEIKRGEGFNDMKKQYRSIRYEYVSSRVINNEKVAKCLATIRINPGTALTRGSESFFDEYYDRIFPDDISTFQVITPWWIDDLIHHSFKGEKKAFFEYERSHVFKNRARPYVLMMVYEALKASSIRDWEKKWVTYILTPGNGEWKRFRKEFFKICSDFYRIIYRVWKRKKEPKLNNFLQSTTTLDDIKQSQGDRWIKILKRTSVAFASIIE